MGILGEPANKDDKRGKTQFKELKRELSLLSREVDSIGTSKRRKKDELENNYGLEVAQMWEFIQEARDIVTRLEKVQSKDLNPEVRDELDQVRENQKKLQERIKVHREKVAKVEKNQEKILERLDALESEEEKESQIKAQGDRYEPSDFIELSVDDREELTEEMMRKHQPISRKGILEKLTTRNKGDIKSNEKLYNSLDSVFDRFRKRESFQSQKDGVTKKYYFSSLADKTYGHSEFVDLDEEKQLEIILNRLPQNRPLTSNEVIERIYGSGVEHEPKKRTYINTRLDKLHNQGKVGKGKKENDRGLEVNAWSQV